MAKPNEPSRDDRFHFVSSKSTDGRRAKRIARSHAIARGLENKRKLQQKSGLNFHAVTLKGDSGRSLDKRKTSGSLITPSVSFSGMSSAFQMLAAESPKLRALLSQVPNIAGEKLTLNTLDKMQHSQQPIFSVLDELVLQNFPAVFRKGLDDHALLSAAMLRISFAITDGYIDVECLRYQGQALSSIRRRMSSPDMATTESTLGAILLLVGVEAQLGIPCQVQLHMGAIQQLLDICRRKGVYLSDGIKRAIFWSDLNASVMTGSSRVVDHTTFSELQWKRDPFTQSFFALPPGFQVYSHLLGADFVDVLKDVFALQCIRDSTFFGKEDTIAMANIDNHQASIQSRLVSLPNCCSISECCHLAAYLCSTMLRCKLWRASTIPSHLSLQLLCKLQEVNPDLLWDDWPELLAWLLHIGGAFAPTGNIRSAYLALLHLNRNTRLENLYSSWPSLLEILKQFIWSEKAFEAQVKAFYEESHI
ncbi:N-ethylmaleimide reductase [Penicillium antarcticum]|uniref:N-ethylmaleimide reductase n=1 Tax=Penicillium antarcticum TaxID=416450 RepID=UPI002397C313|nr:N-ethylmaleimide reductase [Penicillium antarcticum]KAJ5294173.1 N-ethylmaleimide reductase [Penicillium antarcticum]